MAQVTLREYLQETEDAISAERVDDALTHCQTILAQFPESLEAQRLIGEVYLALERLSDAQQNFDWVLTNDPENVVAYCDRALISEHMSDYDTALDCYQQAYELSRGNSHIRQEFNQLSAKAGQQGFMLSRAGLARLYMRGDLLTQAMQEWEAVLAVSPERLDARTGLLETYWREGLYDRVEQLASQILQDVPGCLKALLLLAYVTAAKNMQKAQELLKRAEVLDPDHTMAQELFSDALASQPAEPFLRLLRKPPTLVETALSSSPATAYALPRQEEALAQYATHAPTATGANWNGAEWPSGPSWESDTLVGASSGAQPEHNAAWATNAAPIDDVWSALERQPEVPQPVAEVQHADAWSMYGQPMQDDGQPQNTWQQELQSAPSNEQKQAEPIAWDSGAFDRYKEPSLGGLDSWEALKGNGSADVASAWSSSSKEEAAPAPPAWLNMLTQSERKQASGPLPTATAQPPSTPVQPLPAPVQPPSTPVQPPTTPVQSPLQPAASVQPVSLEKPVQKAEPIVTEPESLDDDEPFSFGPEWLKSLGAASIDMAFPVESSPVAEKAPAPEPVASEPPPEAPRQEVQEPREEPPVVQTPESTEDQRLLRTLEKLESDLRLQGFVPLQPNSLSSLSQNSEPGAEEVIPEHGADVQEATQGPREAYRGEAALSSALAELGNYIHQSSSLLNPSPAQEAESAQPAPEPAQPSPAEEPSWLAALGRDAAFSPAEEPSWIASLNSVPSPSAPTDQITQDETMANLFSSPDQPFWAGLEVPQEQPTQEQPLQESVAEEITEPAAPAWSWNDAQQGSSEEQPAQNGVSEEVVASPIWPASIASNEPLPEVPAAQTSAPFVSATTPSGQLPPVPAPSVQMNGGQEARQSPAMRSEALFDSELEATMKRPAVRLQPMQQRSASQKDILPPSGGRTRATERASGGNASGTMSYQERLSKGYQHQLFGDYDEAMQEYRIVIRNAPELLTDIVNNVRALLKLAPKYATGYRVLGDAYMRQGEYLQAMEAYNKALTMAKRAKN